MSSILNERRRRSWFRYTRKQPKIVPYLEKMNEESPRSTRTSLKVKRPATSPHLERLLDDSLKIARMRFKAKPKESVSQSKSRSGRHLFNIFRRRKSENVTPNDIELEFTGLVPNNKGGRKNRTQRKRK